MATARTHQGRECVFMSSLRAEDASLGTETGHFRPILALERSLGLGAG